jgi:hypothetical protein
MLGEVVRLEGTMVGLEWHIFQQPHEPAGCPSYPAVAVAAAGDIGLAVGRRWMPACHTVQTEAGALAEGGHGDRADSGGRGRTLVVARRCRSSPLR